MVTTASGVMPSRQGVSPQAPVVVHDRPSRESEEYVAAHRDASAYHSRVWLDVIHRAFGHDTMYLVAESGGAVCGVLPLVFFSSRLFGRFTVSVPFVNYGGIVADSDPPRAYEETLHKAEGLLRALEP